MYSVKFYDEIHDCNVDHIARGEETCKGIENRQVNVLEMPTHDEFINESFGTETRE